MQYFKKIINHLKNLGLVKLIALIVKKLKYKQMLKAESLEDRFNMIYEDNLWSSEESISGEGSEVAYTENLRHWLIKKIDELDIKKLVDAPCGDFNWMKHVTKEVDIEYLGIDIVQDIIVTNNSLYKNSNISFNVGNLCKDALPTCDLLMVRDCLFHLSFEDINNFLINISNLEYKYLFTTSHIFESSHINLDIISGDFRYIDLFKEPFNFRKADVIDRVDDVPENHSSRLREMVLIKKQNVPTSISNF